MNVFASLRINKKLSDSDLSGIVEIEKIINKRFLNGERDFYILEALNIMHLAFAVDNTGFISDIFFKFQMNLQKLVAHKQKLYANLDAIQLEQPESLEEQVHLVNIYRSLIADLFDPYITLFVACFQYLEGTFVDFHSANLGLSERSKHEYVLKRLKGTLLFDGYDPLVRNAISHAGSDGVKYEKQNILFKNIKRGTPPIITWVVWSTDELMEKIFSILNFVNGIDCAVDVFGIDIGNLLFEDQELERLFLWEILDKTQRQVISANRNSLFEKISNLRIEEKAKIKHLTNIYFLECAKREMPVSVLKFALDKKTIKIEIPERKIDILKSDEMLGRLLELSRYGIIAEPVFRFSADNIIIAEVDEQGKDVLKMICNTNELRKYGEEEAGLVDLLNDSGTFLGTERLEVQINWDAISDYENKSLNKIFPRKKRS